MDHSWLVWTCQAEVGCLLLHNHDATGTDTIDLDLYLSTYRSIAPPDSGVSGATMH